MINALSGTGSNSDTVKVEPLPAFTDNYFWLLHNGRDAAVVDPGDAAVVMAALAERNLRLAAILITHHHPDHIGGLAGLRAAFEVPVFGPRAEAHRIAGLSHLLDEPERVRLDALDLELEVLTVPGHTLGHIAYYVPRQGWLFCGDTLFAAGCGRLFEGTPAQMHASLQKLARLPPGTLVFCAHEYTLANLSFARAVEPANAAVAAEIERVRGLRAAQQPSLPSNIARERAVNPFLRCATAEATAGAVGHAGRELADPVAVFAELRSWKDGFRANL